MDPTQTPRAVVESNAPRPLLMQVKQNRTLPPGFHPRSPSPSPGLIRYPIHNGAASGPRLGGRPPPELQRLDSRSTLSSPTGQPIQFVQQRPPFVPPRSQITPATSSGILLRASLHPTNLSNQPPLRYPVTSPSPNPRGLPYPLPGQRPPFNPTPQQFLRPQRPPTFETGSGRPPSTHLGIYTSITDNRQVTPQLIPENIGTRFQNNGGTLKNPRTMAAVEGNNTQTILPIDQESLEEMESNDPHSAVDIVNVEHQGKGKNGTPKRALTSQNSNKHDDNDNDNDDDDVIVDMEKDSSFIADIQPIAPNISDSSKSYSSLSRTDVNSIHEERSQSRMSIENSPVTNNQIISRELLLQPETDIGANSFVSDTSKMVEENKLIVDTHNVMDNVANPPRDSATKSPSPKFTKTSPDFLTTSTIPTSSTPSPDPSTGVMGYDNGKLRSLSPKSTKSISPTPSPLTPTSPKLPGTPKKPMDILKIENISENSDDTNNIGRVIEETTVVTKTLTDKLSPPRTPTPGNSSTKHSSFRHSIKSGDGGNSETNSSNQATPLATNGVAVSPTKKLPTKLRDNDKSKPAGSPVKSPTKSIKSLPRTPESGPAATIEKKKVPMNKVQVGAAPSPNLKTVRSKIGSLDNTSYKPGGGKVKIENRKLDFSKAQPKIAAKNDKYAPSGGDKKITQVKLQWNAKPKVGSLDNATYKPGGGDKKIETVKLDFKDKAKPKVGSKENAKHVPGGGTVKSTVSPPKTPQELMNNIETQKIDIKAESKVGSMDNLKHKPGGGDKKIFNDKDYLRQTSSNVESVNGSGAQSPVPSTDSKNDLPTSDENLNQEY